ncbi:hypothetical protein GOD78_18240 [Sinorhizobium medicae]|uniref:hypothetical protein n=1 Tax=Sinorhizobium medicae TaxID=110321 RepID=UPI000FDA30C6|nr:hypothetical protein [Sinorhizobium medicae]MDX0604904.1 hypothetical protein [Sinorhizobium medicae]MDX0819436.1 hypothetical protein [Sinorhizobium medicae]MDX0864317.1 hypothetical protein [Sinorhizobium medicae]RVJ30885.1 hypothetical protein CN179_14370 [Sinorhizobium medicae]
MRQRLPRDYAADHLTSLKHYRSEWYGAVMEAMFGRNCIWSPVNDVARQKSGIDVSVTNWLGQQFFVDDKFRSKDYGDLLVETMSDRLNRRLGWMIKHGMRCDWLHYAILPSRISYFVAYRAFRIAFAAHQEWMEFARTRRHGFSFDQSSSCCGDRQWTTDFMCIPVRVVRAEIGCTIVRWDDAMARHARSISSEIDRLMGLERGPC